MFVRWKQRPLKQAAPWQAKKTYTMYAVLVESVRVNGAPRQKTICYLGRIQEHLRERPDAIIRFWKDVEWKLSGLSLAADVRGRIEASLERVIRRATPQEIEEHKAKWAIREFF